MKYRAFAMILLCVTLTAQAAPLKSYTATYTVNAFGVSIGKANREFKYDTNAGYELKMHTSSASMFLKMEVDESSAGNSAYQPLHYRYTKKKDKDIIKSTADFDWKALTAVSHYKDSVYTLPLKPDTQDKLSYQLQMQQDVMAGKKTFVYTLVDDKKIETYRFFMKGHETLKTALGEIDTIRMEKESDASKRSTTFWLAPKYDYMLVKLEHVEHGVSTTVVVDTLLMALMVSDTHAK